MQRAPATHCAYTAPPPRPTPSPGAATMPGRRARLASHAPPQHSRTPATATHPCRAQAVPARPLRLAATGAAGPPSRHCEAVAVCMRALQVHAGCMKARAQRARRGGTGGRVSGAARGWAPVELGGTSSWVQAGAGSIASVAAQLRVHCAAGEVAFRRRRCGARRQGSFQPVGRVQSACWGERRGASARKGYPMPRWRRLCSQGCAQHSVQA